MVTGLVCGVTKARNVGGTTTTYNKILRQFYQKTRSSVASPRIIETVPLDSLTSILRSAQIVSFCLLLIRATRNLVASKQRNEFFAYFLVQQEFSLRKEFSPSLNSHATVTKHGVNYAAPVGAKYANESSRLTRLCRQR